MGIGELVFILAPLPSSFQATVMHKSCWLTDGNWWFYYKTYKIYYTLLSFHYHILYHRSNTSNQSNLRPIEFYTWFIKSWTKRQPLDFITVIGRMTIQTAIDTGKVKHLYRILYYYFVKLQFNLNLNIFMCILHRLMDNYWHCVKQIHSYIYRHGWCILFFLLGTSTSCLL